MMKGTMSYKSNIFGKEVKENEMFTKHSIRVRQV